MVLRFFCVPEPGKRTHFPEKGRQGLTRCEKLAAREEKRTRKGRRGELCLADADCDASRNPDERYKTDSLTMDIVLIPVSLIFRCGAELEGRKKMEETT